VSNNQIKNKQPKKNNKNVKRHVKIVIVKKYKKKLKKLKLRINHKIICVKSVKKINLHYYTRMTQFVKSAYL
jgi:hypothetical protein